ncbi:hypothetical protein KUCAC02_007154 [Chaenocephalus aceratus]|nr:hypothetical protein KUCAC02_007154 [Chaenocephalus aceratus]
MFLKDYERKVILEKEGRNRRKTLWSWLKDKTDLEGPEEVKGLGDYWNDPSWTIRMFPERLRPQQGLTRRKMRALKSGSRPTRRCCRMTWRTLRRKASLSWSARRTLRGNTTSATKSPDAARVKTYPRSIATSVRTKDDSRRLKRDEVKERKQKEKEQKQEQLKQLKNLKRSEIMEKLKKLQELTGNEQLAFSHNDLKGDFDPGQHDQLMQKFFGDEYYGGAEDEKPQFEADEELEEHWNWDTWTGEDREKGGGEEGEYNASGPHCDDDNFIMDADYDPKVITQSKPVFDPQSKSFEQYLDEYYKLDYEDIIDDLPCRFRYRQVLPNDFGLSTEEILHADDTELNQWASLKKTCMFRSDKEESSDLHNYKIKAKNVKRKKEILSSVYSEAAKELEDAKNKKRTDHLKTQNGESTSVMDSTEETLVTLKEAGDDNEEEEEEVLIPKMKQDEESEVAAAEKPVRNRTERTKWPKAKLKSSAGRRPSSGGLAGVRIGGREFSQQRLKAYGLNPKRLFFRQLGRQRRKDQEKDGQAEKQGVRRHLRNIPTVQSCALSVEDISHPQNVRIFK